MRINLSAKDLVAELSKEVIVMPEEATKEAAAGTSTNCPACNKRIKRIKRYYRNSKYYCSKSCYGKFAKKQKKKQEK